MNKLHVTNIQYRRLALPRQKQPSPIDALLDSLDMLKEIKVKSLTKMVSPEDMQRLQSLTSLVPRKESQEMFNQTLTKIAKLGPRPRYKELTLEVLSALRCVDILSDVLFVKIRMFSDVLDKNNDRGNRPQMITFKMMFVDICCHRMYDHINHQEPLEGMPNVGELLAGIVRDPVFNRAITDPKERFNSVFAPILIAMKGETPWHPVFLDMWHNFFLALDANTKKDIVDTLNRVNLEIGKSAKSQQNKTEHKVLRALIKTISGADVSDPAISQKIQTLCRDLIQSGTSIVQVPVKLLTVYSLLGSSQGFKEDLLLIKQKKIDTFNNACYAILVFHNQGFGYQPSRLLELHAQQQELYRLHPPKSEKEHLILQQEITDNNHLCVTLAKYLLERYPDTSFRLMEAAVGTKVLDKEDLSLSYLNTYVQSALDTGHYLKALSIIKGYSLDSSSEPVFVNNYHVLLDFAAGGALARYRQDGGEGIDVSCLDITVVGDPAYADIVPLLVMVESRATVVTDDLIAEGKRFVEAERAKLAAKNTENTDTAPAVSPKIVLPQLLPNPSRNAPAVSHRLDEQDEVPLRKEKQKTRPLKKDVADMPSTPVNVGRHHAEKQATEPAVVVPSNLKFRELLTLVESSPGFSHFEKKKRGPHQIAVFQDQEGGEHRIPLGTQHSGHKNIIKMGTLKSILEQIHPFERTES